VAIFPRPACIWRSDERDRNIGAPHLIANRPPLENGELVLSDAPGLGWELDANYVDRHRIQRD
jgi:L-alanine-DL-glutamate epimerase-like enolase superfamily enzyme